MLLFAILLLIIIKVWQSYAYYVGNDDKYITSQGDIEKYSHRYSKGKLLHEYNKLSEHDKLFVRDLICQTVLDYKSVRPSFKKMCQSAARQIFGTSILSSVVMNSSVTKNIGQNVLGFFVSNVI